MMGFSQNILGLIVKLVGVDKIGVLEETLTYFFKRDPHWKRSSLWLMHNEFYLSSNFQQIPTNNAKKMNTTTMF